MKVLYPSSYSFQDMLLTAGYICGVSQTSKLLSVDLFVKVIPGKIVLANMRMVTNPLLDKTTGAQQFHISISRQQTANARV